MEYNLKDKVIMVAAASKGLGYGIAYQAANEGANVSIGSRTEEEIIAAAKRIKDETGSETLGTQFDARDGKSIERWVTNTIEQFGRIDGLVVNAGGPPAGKFHDFDEEGWRSAFELTLLSSIRMIKAALPHLEENGGSIVIITSTSVKEPAENLILSSVMRAGVANLVKNLGTELGPKGIRVNSLVPGAIHTDRLTSLFEHNAKQQGKDPGELQQARASTVPLGRFGTPTEFGKAGAFLLSDAASYITGSTLLVDGGATKSVW